LYSATFGIYYSISYQWNRTLAKIASFFCREEKLAKKDSLTIAFVRWTVLKGIHPLSS